MRQSWPQPPQFYSTRPFSGLAPCKHKSANARPLYSTTIQIKHFAVCVFYSYTAYVYSVCFWCVRLSSRSRIECYLWNRFFVTSKWKKGTHKINQSVSGRRLEVTFGFQRQSASWELETTAEEGERRMREGASPSAVKYSSLQTKSIICVLVEAAVE